MWENIEIQLLTMYGHVFGVVCSGDDYVIFQNVEKSE